MGQPNSIFQSISRFQSCDDLLTCLSVVYSVVNTWGFLQPSVLFLCLVLLVLLTLQTHLPHLNSFAIHLKALKGCCHCHSSISSLVVLLRLKSTTVTPLHPTIKSFNSNSSINSSLHHKAVISKMEVLAAICYCCTWKFPRPLFLFESCASTSPGRHLNPSFETNYSASLPKIGIKIVQIQ